VIVAFDGSSTSTSATTLASGEARSQVAIDEPSGNRAAM
jgi:hypothetical protein